MISPITDTAQLEQFAKLGPNEALRSISSQGIPKENVYKEARKEDPTNPHTTTKKVMDWGIYNIKAQHVQTNHIGVNVDKMA